MLVLARYPGEAIQIGNDVRIVVVKVRGNQVRLGIFAPLHIRVNRVEVLDRERQAIDDYTVETLQTELDEAAAEPGGASIVIDVPQPEQRKPEAAA